MNEAIIERLSNVEREHGVRVLYAIESGSRAWGFESKDSDFDVRFIYVQPHGRYLSLAGIRDVIEPPVDEVFDLSGWDLRKALLLFRKSNPPMLEWLGSPIVYLDRGGLAERLRELLRETFSPRSALYHYASMARGNYQRNMKEDSIRLKKYLYVVRPLASCLWIARHGTVPPTAFRAALDDMRLPPSVADAVDDLLRRKMAAGELDVGPRIPALDGWIEDTLVRMAAVAESLPHPSVGFEQLDALFIDMLEHAP